MGLIKDFANVSADQALTSFGMKDVIPNSEYETEAAKKFMWSHDNIALPVATAIFSKFGAGAIQSVGKQFNPKVEGEQELAQPYTGPQKTVFSEMDLNANASYDASQLSPYDTMIAARGLNAKGSVPIEVERGELKVVKGKNGKYTVSEDYKNAPTHSAGGKKIVGSPNEGVDGFAIIPSYFREEVLTAINNGDSDTVDAIRDFLPNASSLAKNGIYVSPANRTKFSDWAAKNEMNMTQATDHIIKHRDKYTGTIMANSGFTTDKGMGDWIDMGVNAAGMISSAVDMARKSKNIGNDVVEPTTGGFINVMQKPLNANAFYAKDGANVKKGGLIKAYDGFDMYDAVNASIAGTSSAINAYGIANAINVAKNATKDWKPAVLPANAPTITADTIQVRDDAMRNELTSDVNKAVRTAQEEARLRGANPEINAALMANEVEALNKGKGKIDQYVTNVEAQNARMTNEADAKNAAMQQQTNLVRADIQNKYNLAKQQSKDAIQDKASAVISENAQRIVDNTAGFFSAYKQHQDASELDYLSLMMLAEAASGRGDYNSAARFLLMAKKYEDQATADAAKTDAEKPIVTGDENIPATIKKPAGISVVADLNSPMPESPGLVRTAESRLLGTRTNTGPTKITADVSGLGNVKTAGTRQPMSPLQSKSFIGSVDTTPTDLIDVDINNNFKGTKAGSAYHNTQMFDINSIVENLLKTSKY